jgi:hypothetical protein
MRPVLMLALVLAACNSGNVKINDGDSDVYDANDHKDNVAPGQPEVNITPSGADTRDELTAEILFPADDADGDFLTYDFVWLVNGDSRPDLDGPTVPKDETERDQRWEVRVRAFDGREYGPTANDEQDIGNAPPSLQLRWKNDAPGTNDPLVIRTNTDDPDGDVVDLSFVWTVGGNVTPYIMDTIPANATSGGELWEVEVTATDEEGDDTTESLDVTIANLDPTITDLRITPNPAPPSANLTASATLADPDGDAFVTTYSWTKDGVATVFTGVQVPASATEDGETWEVTVVVDDQHGGTATSSASVDVINHPPVITGVAIDPSPPGDSDYLYADTSGVSDADGDTLTYTYVWYRNGSVYPSSNYYLEPIATTMGDTWQVSVTVTDGSATAGPVLSAIETIQNRPPVPPVLQFTPAVPNTCANLQCVIAVDSYDPDGTAVVQTVTWKRNGVNYNGTRLTTVRTNDTIPVATMVPGDSWTCHVTTTSGGQSGLPADLTETVLGSTATESFTVTARTQADILLMVDNSCSMGDPQTTFATAANTLITTLDGFGLNYHIGVVTSDMDDVTQSGRMIPGSLGSVYVTQTLATRQTELAGMINVGVNGSGYEKPLAATYAALRPPLSTSTNAGFLRATGGVGILFLTDEDDQSVTPTASTWSSWLRGIRSDADITTWGIIGDPGNGCTNLSTFAAGYAGDLYASVLRDTHGSWTSICDLSYNNSVRDFANAVAGLPRRFPLAQAADPATLSVVKIAPGTGTRTTLTYGTNYTYDSVTHAVLLTATPVNGTTYEVSYDASCTARFAGPGASDTGL